MPKKNFTPEEIIGKLREAEVLLSQGQPLGTVCRGLGVSEVTYYRWRKEFGGLRTDQARRLKELERENARLKKLVADLALDKAILTEVLSGRIVPMNPWAPGQTAPGGSTGARGISHVRAPGVPGDAASAFDAALSGPLWGWRSTADEAYRGLGDALWAVWLSAHYDLVAPRGLAGESQARAAHLAERRLKSVAPPTQTRSVVVQRWVLRAIASAISAACMELRFHARVHPQWTAVSDFEYHR